MRVDEFEMRPKSPNRLPFVAIGCANGFSGGLDRAKFILGDGATEVCSDGGGAIDANSDDKSLERILCAIRSNFEDF